VTSNKEKNVEVMSKSIEITDDNVINKIYHIRGKKVMLDRDLAEMYSVETKQLKRQVNRNKERFPEDFMFEMNKEEFENWRSQFGTSNSSDKMGLRYAPYVFTEQGVAMLSSVLNSETAIEVNIQIIRIFTRIREVFLTNKEVLLKMEQLEKRMITQNEKTNKHEEEIQLIFKALKQLLHSPQEPRVPIGFKKNKNNP
jgi:phage regulator Rha-like protein